MHVDRTQSCSQMFIKTKSIEVLLQISVTRARVLNDEIKQEKRIEIPQNTMKRGMRFTKTTMENEVRKMELKIQ